MYSTYLYPFAIDTRCVQSGEIDLPTVNCLRGWLALKASLEKNLTFSASVAMMSRFGGGIDKYPSGASFRSRPRHDESEE
jgi:hypothetical protein